MREKRSLTRHLKGNFIPWNYIYALEYSSVFHFAFKEKKEVNTNADETEAVAEWLL